MCIQVSEEENREEKNMNYADIAENLFRSGLNCAQAVCGAFSDLYDDFDRESSFRLASPFGGGFARKRELCGAVSGMGLVFGLVCGTASPEEKMKTYERAAVLADRFIEKYQSVVCSELLEMKPGNAVTPREKELTDEEMQLYHWPCIDYVRGAALIVAEYLDEYVPNSLTAAKNG